MSRHRALVTPSVLLLVLCLCTPCSEGADFSVPDGGPFQVIDTPEGPEFVMEGEGVQGVIHVETPLSPGWHTIQGEYRTEGLSPTETFPVDVLSLDYKDRFSAYEQMPAAAEWSTLRVFCRADEARRCMIRFGSPKDHSGEWRIAVRDIAVAPFTLRPGGNMLGNPGFETGPLGGLPALWTWKYHEGNPGDYALAEDKTFRRGERIVRVTSDGAEGRTLVSKLMPLPDDGEMTFAFWARSGAPKATVHAMLIGNGWGWQNGQQFAVTDSWRRYELSAPCPDEVSQPFCWARLNTPAIDGTIEFAEASVTWQGEVAEEPAQESEWLGVPGRNMLANPGFELGGMAWTYDFFAEKGLSDYLRHATCDPAVLHPGAGDDGGAAFELPPGPSFYSHCFPVIPGRTYTASAWMRATRDTGEVWWAVIDTGWKMYARTTRDIPSDRWERYSFTFTWEHPIRQNRGYIRFNTGGDVPVLIDRVQLEERPLSDYAPPPIGVGLVFEDAPIFTRGQDTPEATLRIVPAGAVPGGARVSVVARDAWGREAWAREVPVDGPERTEVTLALPADRLGTFHVRMTATAPDGRLLGIADQRYAIIDPPARPAEGELGLFGICYETPRLPPWHITRSVRCMRALGTTLNRFFMTPVYEEADPPEAYVAALRRQCEIQRDAGIELIGCVNFFPSDLGDRIVLVDDPTEEALAEYGDRVRRFVSAMRGHIRYWEVLNEPHLWRFRSGERAGQHTMPPEKYIRVLKAAHAAIKAADPDLVVVAPCIGGRSFDYLERLMELGAAPYIDAFSCHTYRTSPDMPDAYSDLVRLRGILDGHGWDGLMLNSEQYFGANLYAMRGNDEEVSRGYYLPQAEELRTAGRSIRNYIHHVAAGMPYCAFAPGVTLFRIGPGDELLLWDLFAAYNAATRMLLDAGSGRPLDVGQAIRAFLFENAPGGPLLCLYSPAAGLRGRMHLDGDFRAWDIMGNELTAEEKAEGLPLATDPVYLRFPAGTDPAGIEGRLGSALVTGLGDPMALTVALAGADMLRVTVVNKHNRPLSGTVALQDLPDGWECARSTLPFEDLLPGRTTRLGFELARAPMRNLGRYPVTVLAEAGEEFVRREVTLSPVFARQIPAVTADADLSEWVDADWIELGEDNLSRDFDPNIRHAGAQDLSARLACGWNSGAFALALEVTDDRMHEPEAPPIAWQRDSVQVYFDQLNDADPLFGTTRNYGDDIAYNLCLIDGRAIAWVDKGAEGRFIGEANRTTGIDGEVRMAARRRGTTSIYEVVFPARVLPSVELESGGGFGFSLLINDSDGEGRKVGLTLAPEGSEPYGRPHEFRDLILVPRGD